MHEGGTKGQADGKVTGRGIGVSIIVVAAAVVVEAFSCQAQGAIVVTCTKPV